MGLNSLSGNFINEILDHFLFTSQVLYQGLIVNMYNIGMDALHHAIIWLMNSI